MATYEVQIALSDGSLVVMMKTNDLGEATSYRSSLRTSGKYSRNVVKVVQFCDICGDPLQFPNHDDPKYRDDSAVASRCGHVVRQLR